MLDRVTHRMKMREELITITRMLMGLPPAVRGDLPPPDPERDAKTEAVEAVLEGADVPQVDSDKK